jgi:23S rRNA-/tRNA-specific pseudouridylate synthase
MCPVKVDPVYEDEWLLVLDKPAGLPTQAARQGAGDNLYDQARARHPYVGLHHRLDVPVSGLVLLTLDPRANEPIARAFRDHQIARSYLAVAAGEAQPGPWTWPIEGKRAHTDVEVLGAGRGLSALRLSPQTGRTHQLRIHAAMAGTPLVGDRQYADASAWLWPRLALHAAQLALQHPITGAPLTLTSPLPSDLRELWARFVPM